MGIFGFKSDESSMANLDYFMSRLIDPKSRCIISEIYSNTLWLGNGAATSTKTIYFNKAGSGAANPGVRWNHASQKCEYSDNGSGWSSFSGLDDKKVKISDNDSSPGFLNGKLAGGAAIALTENNDGGNESLEIDCTIVDNSAVWNSVRGGIKVTADGTSLTTGDGKAYFPIPAFADGMNLYDVEATVSTASTSGTPTIQLARIRSGAAADMLTTRITIDENEISSKTAAAPPVIDSSNDDVATGDQLRIDVDVSGDARGLNLIFVFREA